MDCLRLEGVDDNEVLRMNGVRPEEADSDSVAGPGSENLTRFFARFGVAGGVDIPCGCGIVFGNFVCEVLRECVALLRLFLRSAIGLSSLTILETSDWSSILITGRNTIRFRTARFCGGVDRGRRNVMEVEVSPLATKFHQSIFLSEWNTIKNKVVTKLSSRVVVVGEASKSEGWCLFIYFTS